MRVEAAHDLVEVADRAAAVIAALLREVIEVRGRATLAVSGGRTPGDALSVLAGHDLPWHRVQLFQVDERVAPDGHVDRNLELLRHRVLPGSRIPPRNVHPMPVTDPDLEDAAARYAAELAATAGDPPVLDVVQLGLGADGHTASLVPDDPVLEVADRDVAVTGPYQGRRRMTLTLPALARARWLVWVVQGADKASAVTRLLADDPALPAARLPRRDAVLVVDDAALATPTVDRGSDEEEVRP